ncbi:lysozyme inhibitor LprI family protein [Azovibrio restrictus]|uniref:lysozyme inhibitor LprI family protein n=1 Tax=Azovibrio restrictus TaxID=146938 RepID=UPI0026F15D6D|nr:lysozyme inhibitor LprI family protein [Azovibrio restrictus]MDD3483480.1 lysozyme inhibitor LprI family protein [Azovibrio restrictus]
MTSKTLLLCAVLTLSPGALWAQTACAADPADREQACLKARLEESYQAIRQAQEDLAAAFALWGQDAVFKNMLKKSLSRAEEDFWRYRASQCAFEGALPAQGYDARGKIAQLSCEISLNEQHARQLLHALDAYPPFKFDRINRSIELRE